MWAYLQLYFQGLPKCKDSEEDKQRRAAVKNLIKEKYIELGPLSYAEKNIIVCFVLLIGMWLFRSPGFMPGWGDFMKTKNKIGICAFL